MYWKPPKQALDRVKDLVEDPFISGYGAHGGLPELREALIRKVSHCKEFLKLSN